MQFSFSKILKTAFAQRRHIANMASFVGTRLISIAAFAFSVPFFIRHTSDEQYGIVAIGFSLLGLSTLFDVAIGYVITQSVGRRFARSGKLNLRILDGLFSIYLYTAGIFFLICAFGLVLSPFDIEQKVYYVSLALLLPGLAVSGIVTAIFQAKNELSYINLSRFGFEIGKACALIISAVVVSSYVLIGPSLVIVILCRAIVDFNTLNSKLKIQLKLISFWDALQFYKIARIGFSSFLTVILTLLVSVSDKILIKKFLTVSDVAYYSIAFDLNAKAYLIANAVNTTMFAVILKNHAKKKNSNAPVILGLAAVCFVVCIYYLPVFFFSEFIISKLVSTKFASRSAHLASVMSIASVLYLFGNVFENATTAMGGADLIMKTYIFAVALYFLSLPVFVNRYALNGFMYSYVLFCAGLCTGFIYSYSLKYRNKFQA